MDTFMAVASCWGSLYRAVLYQGTGLVVGGDGFEPPTPSV
jgi:hypothetical protein